MAASVLEVLITGDATSLKLAFTQATAATEQYVAATKTASAATQQATTTSKLFGSISQYAFTAAKLGVLAFAAVSTKAAIDFNRQFTQIAAITNTSADAIGGLKDTVIALSNETGVGAVEVAHSLYFLASAGLTTQQQMDALDASAKGTAIGLGDAGDLARITANALNVFADNGLTAAGVMDTLVAAVREGTAEPDEFAAALGRVLPIADQAGISFQSVAASLATMSNAGLDVNEGVTALRAILQSLVAPTAQTETAFKNMGLSVDQVVRSMQSQGLLATLRLVQDAAKKATGSQGEFNQMMRHAIPNIRGLAGALNLLHQDSGKVDEIFKQVKNSTGDMAQAFETTQASAAFRITQTLNELANVGMQIATSVLPPIATALEAIVPPIAAILPYAVELGAAWLAWIAIPPVLSGIGVAMMVARGGAIALTEAVTTLNFAAFGPWVAVAAIAVITLGALTGNFKIAAIGVGALVVEIGYLGNAFTEAQAKMGAFGLAIIAVSEAWKSIKGLQGQTADAATGFAHQMETQNEALAATTQRVTDALGPRQKFLDSLFSSTPNHQAYIAWDQAVKQVTDDIHNQNAQITQGTPLLDDYSNLLDSTSTTSLKLHGAFAQILTDYYKQNDGLRGLNTVQLNNLITAGRWHDAINLVSDALDRSDAAIRRQALAQQSLHQSIIAGDFAKLAPFVSSLGMSFTEFQQAATAAFNGSKEDADKFITDMTSKWTDAWNQFRDTAVSALDFTGKALDDLGQAAQSAQEQLAGDTSSMSKDALAQLGDQATITGGEIVSAFKAANEQTKQFAQDLLEIASRGDAGKALASSLLEAGNTAAAAAISGSPMEKQIVALYGKNEAMVQGLSTKLTNSIVGPLDKIVSLLTKLARHWGLTINANTGPAKKKVDDFRNNVNSFTSAQHRVELFLEDKASGKLTDIQTDTEHLTANMHKVTLGVEDTVARNQLQTFENNLDRLTSRKFTVNVGVHTKGESPMPDEALKQHLFDPMKAAGFKRVGDVYTLPLVVGAHTEAQGPDGGGKNSGLGALRDLEKRQLGVLLDIRAELRHGAGVAGAGGIGGSMVGGSSGSTGSTSSADFPKQIERQLKDFRIYISSVQSTAAAKRWSSAITEAIQSGDMAKEAKLLHQAMRDMAEVTNQKEAAKAFHDFQGAVQDFERAQNQAEMKQHMADALAYATHNVPRLPRGHTNISVNHHEGRHRREVTLDRKRFTDAASYDVDYARGF